MPPNRRRRRRRRSAIRLTTRALWPSRTTVDLFRAAAAAAASCAHASIARARSLARFVCLRSLLGQEPRAYAKALAPAELT